MSVPAVVYAALQSLVSGRCYPSEFPQRDGVLPTWPAIRYTVIDQDAPASQCGTNDESTDDTTVQIDVVARDYAAMRTLKAQVITALADTDPPCSREMAFEEYDAETKTHRAILRFLFIASSQA